MLQETLFNIPYYTIPTLNFKEKKKKLTNLLNSYPEEKHGIQTFHTNRQSDRSGLSNGFAQIMGEELGLLTERLKHGLNIEDIWSVSYGKNDYHSPHNHGSLGYSGILYLNLPKDSPGTSYIQPWNHIIDDMSIYYPIPVNEGTIVVVPQFIMHFSPPNKSTKRKRIISWDMTAYKK